MSGILPQYRSVTDDIISIYVEEGGALHKLVLCHQDGSGDDVSYQERLLKMELWLEYDTFGSEVVFAFGDTYIQLPTDSQRIAELATLIGRGFLGQPLISQDVCYQTGKRSWGGHGLAHILDSLLPRFEAGGIDRTSVMRLMRDHPSRLFSYTTNLICGPYAQRQARICVFKADSSGSSIGPTLVCAPVPTENFIRSGLRPRIG